MGEIQTIDAKTLKVYQLSGSSAGASSGDFHVYRQHKHAEQDRLAQMDADRLTEVNRVEFERKKRENEVVAEMQRLKRVEKRQKKRQRVQQAKRGKHGDADSTQADGDANKSGDDHSKTDDSKKDNESDSKHSEPMLRPKRTAAITIVDTDS